jgi:hypothetical protein
MAKPATRCRRDPACTYHDLDDAGPLLDDLRAARGRSHVVARVFHGQGAGRCMHTTHRAPCDVAMSSTASGAGQRAGRLQADTRRWTALMGAWYHDMSAGVLSPSGRNSVSSPTFEAHSHAAGHGYEMLPTSQSRCRAAAPAAYMRHPAPGVKRRQLVNALQPRLALRLSAELLELDLHMAAAACQPCSGALPHSDEQ